MLHKKMMLLLMLMNVTLTTYKENCLLDKRGIER